MFDEALDALKSDQRRRVLFALLAGDSRSDPDPAIVPDAAEGDPREDLSIETHHVHLPKLADYGFIEWDRETGEIRRGPNFGKIRPLLELLRDHAEELPEGWVQPEAETAWRPIDGDRRTCGID